jgi:adenylate cyclase
MKKPLKKILGGAALGLAATGAAFALGENANVGRFEDITWDSREITFAHPVDKSSKVKVVALDNPSIDWGNAEHQFSKNWPRYAYAPIIDFCRRAGVKAVAFDMLYLEPANDPGEDEALGKAVKESGRFVAAALPTDTPTGTVTAWPVGVADRFKFNGVEAWMKNHGLVAHLLTSHAALSIPEVTSNAAALGHVRADTAPDADATARRVTAFQVFDGHVIPSLSLAALQLGDGRLDANLGAFLSVGGRHFPLDSKGRFILRYRSRSQGAFTFDTTSASSIMQSEALIREGKPPLVDPAEFKDRYVIFGVSATGLFDNVSTPLANNVPGFEVHATLLDNLLRHDLLSPTPIELSGLFTIFVSVFAGTAILFCASARPAVITGLVVVLIPAAVGFIAYDIGYAFPIVVPSIAVALALIGGGVANYATEGRQRLFIGRAFAHYLSPKVIQRVLDDPSRLRLGGEKREVSIYFSDIAGFSTFSEQLDPQALSEMLNDYLTEMTQIIHEEDGTLDKYIGDAIVAFWNAPTDQPDHALRACRAAVRCQRRLAEIRPRFAKPIHMRVGLNTGEVSVGNFGSRDHFDYTMIGDAANLASRLEGSNKAFGTAIMASQSMWDKLGGQIVGRETAQIRVVGRESLVRVFEPWHIAGEEADPRLVAFLAAQSLCRRGEWDPAEVALAALPEDKLAQVYLKRLHELRAAGATEWNDIWNLTSK